MNSDRGIDTPVAAPNNRLAECAAFREIGRGRNVFRKIKHTFLQLPFLYRFVITEAHHQRILAEDERRDIPYLVQRVLEKSLWFWPRAVEARHWAAGKPGKRYTPTNFLALDEPAAILLDAVEDAVPNRNAEILDLGCNAGRHLNELRTRGYTKLHGVDAMGSALSLMREHFPETYAAAEVKHDLFQSFLMKQPDRRFDALFTHGATIELVHPSFDIVGNMARVTKSAVIMLIDEQAPEYYQRFWIYEFGRNGFHLFKCIRPISAIQKATDEIPSCQSLFVFVRTSI